MSSSNHNDHNTQLQSSSSADDFEQKLSSTRSSNSFWKQLDQRFSGRRLRIVQRSCTVNRPDCSYEIVRGNGEYVIVSDVTPEWALLLIGCLLGLATGLCVAAFNLLVSSSFSPN